MAELPPVHRVGRAQFKDLLRQQFLILKADEAGAIQAMPDLLPRDREEREAVLDAIRRVVASVGALPPECQGRMAQIEALFGAGPTPVAAPLSADRRSRARALEQGA